METLSKKIILSILVILLIIMPIKTFAANSKNVAIVKAEGDYIIYLEGLENKEFKFAFTNTNLADKTLSYIANWEDTNGVNIACLEKDAKVDFSKDVYIAIKEGEGEKAIYSSTKLNLSNAITKEDMAKVEALTKKIAIDTSKSTTTSKDEDGVIKTTSIGQINITDSKDCDYKYELIKLDGTEADSIKQFIGLVNTLNDSYKSMSMYNKVLVATGIRDSYKELFKARKLVNVENMTIMEPKEAVEGDKYLVLIQKEKDGKIVTDDIQFLTCTNGEDKEVVKETKVVKETAVLPVTYDSIVLIVVLAVILVLIAVVVIRMRKLNAKENNK